MGWSRALVLLASLKLFRTSFHVDEKLWRHTSVLYNPTELAAFDQNSHISSQIAYLDGCRTQYGWTTEAWLYWRWKITDTSFTITIGSQLCAVTMNSDWVFPYLSLILNPMLLILCFIHSAEKYLESVEGTANYAILLLTLIELESADFNIRQSSAITFKNFVKRNWRIVS